VRQRPIPESRGIKGQGLDNKARLIKVPLTHRQASDRPTGINRSKTHFPVLVWAVRLQVANVPVRNRCTAGVQVPPKLSVLVNYAERGNPGLRPLGRL